MNDENTVYDINGMFEVEASNYEDTSMLVPAGEYNFTILRKKIEKTKDEVLHLIDQRAFPFQNAEIERLFQAFLDRNRPQN
jgi:hypothetical protein